MTVTKVVTVSFLIAAVLLSTNVWADNGEQYADKNVELKSILSRDSCPRICPSRCTSRRRAVRLCRTRCARTKRCRVIQDRRCPSRPRRFRCVPRRLIITPTPTTIPTPTSCPYICRATLQQAINDCTPPIFRALGCVVVRKCTIIGAGTGFSCALPVAVAVTTPPPTTTAVITTAAMTTAASTAPVTTAASPAPTATPSRTPTPSPSCQLTMQGSIGQPGISGVCTCGTSTSTVILLQATGGISQACLNACYDDLLEDICVPNTLFRFASLGSGVVASCCTTVCGGMTIPEFNQCG